jgi:predicted DsbA family dithiol-disulfide isomerase
MKNAEQNALHCDPITGTCAVAGAETTAAILGQKPVTLLYFTDPICSSCWGIDPQLRKLKAEYGDYFDIDYRMGGLLKSWESYGGSDVQNPVDVAQHWYEAGLRYNMPINGEVWLQDPLHSSYPPAIAVKAAQMQDAVKASFFLRRIKEMVFTENKNITRWEHLAQAAADTHLDADRMKADIAGPAVQLFEADLALARQYGVRGFPTIFFSDAEDNRFKVYGAKPYEVYEQALLKLVPHAVKKGIPTSYESVFAGHETLSTQEFALLNNRDAKQAQILLEYLQSRGEVEPLETPTGSIWKAMPPLKKALEKARGLQTALSS